VVLRSETICRKQRVEEGTNTAKHNKLFSERKFVRRCVTDETETVFPENIIAFENAMLTERTAVRNV
jgi:hypothetical protein